MPLIGVSMELVLIPAKDTVPVLVLPILTCAFRRTELTHRPLLRELALTTPAKLVLFVSNVLAIFSPLNVPTAVLELNTSLTANCGSAMPITIEPMEMFYLGTSLVV